MSRPTREAVRSTDCLITRTSDHFEFMTDYKYEVYDLSRGRKLLSQWKNGEDLLERMKEVDHTLTSKFQDYLSRNEEGL